MERSASAEMTFPRADKDLLILAPSFKRSPVAPVESARSEPFGKKIQRETKKRI